MNNLQLKELTLQETNFSQQMGFKLKTQDGRMEFFKWISSFGNHWQKNHTPLSLVRKMVEFIESLVFDLKLNIENIYFVADNELECQSATKIYKVQSYFCKHSGFDSKGNPTYDVKELSRIIEGINMKFDLVLSNPPYENEDIKILTELVNFSREIIVVHPSTWILDKKGKQTIFNKFLPLVHEKIKSLEFFNANPVFGIDQFVPDVISHFDMNGSKECSVNWFNQIKYISKNNKDISVFEEKWITLVSSFYLKMKNYTESNSSIWDNKLPKKHIQDSSKFYVQLAQIRGNVIKNSKGDKLVEDDFYTIIMPSSNKNKGIRLNIETTPSYAFNTEIEQNNFIEFLKTDFARFCLAIYKTNSQLARGELALIPWLDFTASWDDEKLFEKFDVSQELQDYIRDFLPDYYGIRK
jgi:hypothetical protein